MNNEDEGLDFEGAFVQRYNGGSKDRAQARAQRERRAAMTPAQRQRKGPPTKQVNFRATAETQAQIAALAAHFDSSATDVIVRAVAALARATLPGGKR